MDKNKTYGELKDLLNQYMDKTYVDFVDKYYEQALKIHEGMKRETGEDYIYHPINVAYILAELKMDPVTIGCAIIHEAITLDKMTYEEVEEMFGTESADILMSITKISHLKQTFKVSNPEKYRRIIVGLSENPATLFIKFADRLHNLRTVNVHDLEHQKYIIEETQNIYIPLAHRLGMKKMKSEMEDLCLQYTDPIGYNDVLNKINANKTELEKSLSKMKYEIMTILDNHNIKYEIVSRVKSVRGIYNKLKAGKRWEDIYDLLGLRVLVDNIEDCYRVIGLVQAKYQPIPNRFKDYIANPKANMYQSLHTTMYGEDKRVYELQVRTYEMDEVAEIGIAAHWSYKEDNKTYSPEKEQQELSEKLRWYRELLTYAEMNESDEDPLQDIKNELFNANIYVFTPKGDVIDMPLGANPLDFAYRIHTEVGNHTVGAIVNNKIVPLTYKLKTGDVVEIKTNKNFNGPTEAWLKICATNHAKHKITAILNKRKRDDFILRG